MEPVTEPSGGGAFAEAMRELIAELRPVRMPPAHRPKRRARPCHPRTARLGAPLRLVRG